MAAKKNPKKENKGAVRITGTVIGLEEIQPLEDDIYVLGPIEAKRLVDLGVAEYADLPEVKTEE